MTSGSSVFQISEIELGQQSLLIEKIAPESIVGIQAEVRMRISENNPIAVRILGEEKRAVELQDMLSMDCVDQIILERTRVYRVIMKSEAQYRIWIQNTNQSSS